MSIIYETPFGPGELKERTPQALRLQLGWGEEVELLVPATGTANASSFARLSAPRGPTHPASQAHPLYSRSIPHGINAGWTFSLPPVFERPVDYRSGKISRGSGQSGDDQNEGGSFDIREEDEEEGTETMRLWEEITVRPDITEELEMHRVMPQHWHPWLAGGSDDTNALSSSSSSSSSSLPLLTPLQTTGSGDCLLNALALGLYGVQDRTQPIVKGDIVLVRMDVGSERSSSNDTEKGDEAHASDGAREEAQVVTCRVSQVTPDGTAVAVVPISSLSSLHRQATAEADSEIVVPRSNLVGEGEEEEEGERSPAGISPLLGGSRTLGRQWATLRLLLSIAMRESAGAFFSRWARDRLADVQDEGFLDEKKEQEQEKKGGEDGDKNKKKIETGGAQVVGTQETSNRGVDAEEKEAKREQGEKEEEVVVEDAREESGDAAQAPTSSNQRDLPALQAAAAQEEALTSAFALRDEWRVSLDDAGTPKRSLLPEHVWVLANLLRRPIIIYGPRFQGYPWNVLHNVCSHAMY